MTSIGTHYGSTLHEIYLIKHYTRVNLAAQSPPTIETDCRLSLVVGQPTATTNLTAQWTPTPTATCTCTPTRAQRPTVAATMIGLGLKPPQLCVITSVVPFRHAKRIAFYHMTKSLLNAPVPLRPCGRFSLSKRCGKIGHGTETKWCAIPPWQLRNGWRAGGAERVQPRKNYHDNS
jgi:hypothetical protein